MKGNGHSGGSSFGARGKGHYGTGRAHPALDRSRSLSTGARARRRAKRERREFDAAIIAASFERSRRLGYFAMATIVVVFTLALGAAVWSCS